jgi:hypothetical protein
MDLHNFSKFSEAIKTLNEQANALNEAIKSSILRDLEQMKGFSGWRGTFFTGFHKKFNVDLNELGDNYFTVVDANTAKQMMKRKDDKMIFIVYDNWQNPEKTKKSKDKYGVAITYQGKALYNGFQQAGRWASDKMGIGKWDRQYFMGNYDKLGNFNYKHLTAIANEFYVLDIESVQNDLSTVDKADARADSKQGALALMTDRDIRDENAKRYQEILKAKVDPKSVMEDALAVFQVLFNKLMEASAGGPDEFVKQMDVNYKWDGWNENLIGIVSQVVQNLKKYSDTYSRWAEAAAEMQAAKDADKDKEEKREYYSGQWQLDSTLSDFTYYKKQINKAMNAVNQIV